MAPYEKAGMSALVLSSHRKGYGGYDTAPLDPIPHLKLTRTSGPEEVWELWLYRDPLFGAAFS